MFGRKLLIATMAAVGCGVCLGWAPQAVAQLGPRSPQAMTPRLPGGGTLVEGFEKMGRNLDRLGKNLVGGIAPDWRSNARRSSPGASVPLQVERRPGSFPSHTPRTSPRAGQGNASVYRATPRSAPRSTGSTASQQAARRTSPQAGRTSSMPPTPARTSNQTSARPAQAANQTQGNSARPSLPLALPLHERLTALRQSAFQEGQAADADAGPDAQMPPEYAGPRAAGSVSQPNVQITPGIAVPGSSASQTPAHVGLGADTGISDSGSRPTRAVPGLTSTSARPGSGISALDTGDTGTAVRGQTAASVQGGLSSSADAPVVRAAPGLSEALRRPEAVGPWGRIVPGVVPSGTSGPVGRQVAPQGQRGESIPAQNTAQGTQQEPTPGSQAAATAAADEDVLIAGKGPTISVQTIGPRSITVGRESGYELRVRNSGQTGADDLVVLVDLPAWAEIVGAEASTGATRLGTAGDPAQPFRWEVGRLPAAGEERLVLRIVPRQSRPFELAVRWDYRSSATQAAIEVREPKLALNLDGPRDVLYGKTALYRLDISNPGTGDAENVMIRLMPLGPGERDPAEHRLGRLPAGEHRTVEVELTARQTGELSFRVQAEAEGGVKAEASAQVLVRRPALAVKVEGPKMQYVGATAGYRVKVSNPGTAAAEGVQLLLELSPGVSYLSGIEAQRLEEAGRKLAWSLGSLPAGAEKTFDLKCRLQVAGQSRIGVVAAAQEDLSAAGETTTAVEAMADLVLEVNDPAGPVPVGQEAVYELRVRNRGTERAENVEVRAYFSRGVEPVGAEGGLHQLGPGQVMFQPIPTVAPGAEVVLRVRARADVPGNHILRAEVHAQRPSTRLASEEATYFYQETAARPTQPSAAETSEVPEVAETPSPTAPPGTVSPPPWTTDRAEPTAAVPSSPGTDLSLPPR